MKFFSDFRAFVLKGNIIDLAAAVIIGTAFGAIISSLVEDVITPLLLNPAMKAAHVNNIDQLTAGSVKYGKFLAAVIKFILVAFVVFVIVKTAHKLMKKKEAAAVPSTTDLLLTEIRDELKKNNTPSSQPVSQPILNP